MKTLLTFSVLIGIAVLFSCSQEKKPVTESIPGEIKVASTDTVSKAKIEKNVAGEKIFMDNCISCHGLDGKLKHNEAKDLSISVLPMDERIKIISSAQTIGSRYHKPRFPNVLSEDDIKNVAEYIGILRK